MLYVTKPADLADLKERIHQVGLMSANTRRNNLDNFYLWPGHHQVADGDHFEHFIK